MNNAPLTCSSWRSKRDRKCLVLAKNLAIWATSQWLRYWSMIPTCIHTFQFIHVSRHIIGVFFNKRLRVENVMGFLQMNPEKTSKRKAFEALQAFPLRWIMATWKKDGSGLVSSLNKDENSPSGMFSFWAAYPIEWGDFPSVRPSIHPSLPSDSSSQAWGPASQAWSLRPEAGWPL